MQKMKDKKEKIEIKLSEKEAFVLWSIMCWFDEPLVAHSLKARFAGELRRFWNSEWLNGPRRNSLDKRYEKKIMQNIAKTGTYIEKRHPEWIK